VYLSNLSFVKYRMLDEGKRRPGRRRNSL